MVCKTFKSCLVGSSKTNTCRNNLLACRVGYVLSGSFVHAIEMIDVHQNAVARVKGFKAFQVPGYAGYASNILRNKSALVCTAFTYFQTRRCENVTFYTKQDFLFHIDTTSSESEKPRFRLLEIEANPVIYRHLKFFK